MGTSEVIDGHLNG